MDREEFMKALNEIAIALGVEISQERADIYYKYLKPLRPESLAYALNRMITGFEYRGRPYFPTIAQIKQEATGYLPEVGKIWNG